MITKKIIFLTVAFIGIAACFYACKADPWSEGTSSTDVVTITKTTNLTLAKKYGNIKKGAPLLKSQVGVVKMSHKAHLDAGLKCIDCHHKHDNPARVKKCATCHFGQEGYEIMHGLCLDCHIEKKQGPQKCKECH